MKIKKISSIVVDIPLTRPHVMSLVTVKDVNYLFVRIEGENGAVGWGETSFLGGPTWSEESVESAAAVVNKYVGPLLIGKDFEQIESLRHFMETLVRGNHFALAAIELALWDLLGQTRGLPVYDLLGGLCRDRVPMSWSLAAGSIEADLREAEEMSAKGNFVFKFKTGLKTPEEDAQRIKAVREAFPQAQLRADANQGWDRAAALRACRLFEPYRLDFIEQPVPKTDIDSLEYINKHSNTPIMADESLESIQAATQLVKRDAVGVFGIKLSKAGGLLGGKRLAGIAEGACFPCYVGSMFETPLCNAAHLHFCCSTPQVVLGCELFGPMLLADQVTNEMTAFQDGHVLLERGKPGFGITMNEQKLKQYARGPFADIT
ncbi:mandelate racemase/muconate lactonizing enzyme family protein [Flintibacter muris]|uniref:mandelate racemase/muconate lactonizing enzyme family protein n=1 Tax=Flintibacter muris TaxID=2941327 RepID=UPI00203D2041|nr:enolase C-terminal domain-like protein [Flintibacter muris]